MSCLGLTISSLSLSSMSPAVTAPSLLTERRSNCVSRENWRNFTRFMFSTISVTSSTTPSIVVNSCIAPSTLNDVIAAPSSDDSSTRRRLFPMVYP
jgi:hypothetical protein